MDWIEALLWLGNIAGLIYVLLYQKDPPLQASDLRIKRFDTR